MKKILISILSLFFLVSGASAYMVKSGDTLNQIAQSEGMSLSEILEINQDIENPDLIYVGQEIQTEASFGGTNQVAGSTYNIAGSGVNSTQTSIILSSLTIPQTGYEILTADLSDTFYITIDPGNKTRQEIASCTTVTQSATDNTATLSGCTRGLKPYSPFTEDSDYKFSHAGGSQVIFSDPPQIFEQYGSLANDETVTGKWTFGAFPIFTDATLPTSSTQFATKGYVDDVGAGGFTSSNVSTTQGLQVYGTSPETVGVNASTTNGIVYLSDGSIGVKTNATSIYVDANGIGLDTSKSHTWSGNNVYTATTTMASTTITDLDVSGSISFGSLNTAYSGLLGVTTSTSNLTGSTDYQQLSATTTIPADSMGANGILTGKLYINTLNINNAASRTISVRLDFGSSNLLVTISNEGGTSVTGANGYIEYVIQNLGSNSSQVVELTVFLDGTTSPKIAVNSSVSIMSIDTSSDQDFSISAVLENGSDRIQTSSGYIELKRLY